MNFCLKLKTKHVLSLHWFSLVILLFWKFPLKIDLCLWIWPTNISNLFQTILFDIFQRTFCDKQTFWFLGNIFTKHIFFKPNTEPPLQSQPIETKRDQNADIFLHINPYHYFPVFAVHLLQPPISAECSCQPTQGAIIRERRRRKQHKWAQRI